MNPELLEQLVKSKDESLVRLESTKSVIDTLTKALREPLSVAEATIIIKQIWAEDEFASSKLLVKLTEADPSGNSDYIRSASLSTKTYESLTEGLVPVIEYIKVAHEFVLSEVAFGIDKLKTSGAYDQVAQFKYDEFRKQVLRYLDYCDSMFYELDDRPEVKSWEDLTEESYRVESGDYLFIDDLMERVNKAQNDILKDRLYYGREDNTSLSDLKYSAVRWGTAVKLPIWFATFLLQHLTAE